MPFEPPRWWWIGLLVALVLLTTGGALSAVEAGMQDNYASDGCASYYGGPRATEEQPEDVDCRDQRLKIGIVEAVSRATFGPGIAMAILAGVYLLGSAVATAIGKDDEADEPDNDRPSNQRKGGDRE